MTVIVDPSHFHEHYLYFFGVYGDAEIAALRDICREASVLFDIGANAGFISLAVAAACPSLKVFAFEPDPVMAGVCEDNFRRNPRLLPRLRLVRKAAGDADGDAEFLAPNYDNNPETGRLAGATGTGTRWAVQVARLDSFCRETGILPDVVKIDVEGTELEVLDGMEGLGPEHWPDAVLLETHGQYFAPRASRYYCAVATKLRSRGYVLRRLSGDQWLPLPEEAQSLGDREHILAVRDGPVSPPAGRGSSR